jgi:hypothetical protein
MKLVGAANNGPVVLSYPRRLAKVPYRWRPKPIILGRRMHTIVVFDEPTGWEKVDRQIAGVIRQLGAAETEEQWQTVGLDPHQISIFPA